ncbi:MSMEG_0567/Sll0786 family nitrogen starvation N-acetyltransferase [Dactylococcopsis salina]|uniref:N-acetyltransferase, MSMEG_0567 N-terminal domain family n=1 Tax=Dactylococcopsis salina (strain PCC 8305) TaxID=13035 RepID=K9YVE9_DACS8|nr:MSMEG_0567/Sll0786 family nitrogen starvation N-acetyltransferase [Dactylococcopsis salina]AFZ50901.1 putative N-acetyltransferase, MSMEG_0567 N-terminal domain family [Dactylococcopsis salina PCC 8305]
MPNRRYQFQLAQSQPDIQAYFDLRQQIFCQEQNLFTDHDQDQIDLTAHPIVAIDTEAPNRVVGVVRIYEQQPRLWYGGRLGVHPDYRRVGRIGKGLIYKAVTTAHTWGCDRFLATVQQQNVRFFQRQHWHALEELIVRDRPHHLMEADLNFYPPAATAEPVSPSLLKFSVIRSLVMTN